MFDDPGGRLRQAQKATPSEIFPLIRRPRDLARKTFFWPVVATVLFGLRTLMQASAPADNPGAFNTIVGLYLCFMSTYFIYRLCGKKKPISVIIAVMAFSTILMFWDCSIFLGGLFGIFTGGPTYDPTASGGNPKLEAMPWLFRLWVYFVRVGFSEELTKAAPVLALLMLGRFLPAKLQGWRIREPLDAIFLAAVSAATFAMIETTLQYAATAAGERGVLAGVQSEIGRLIGLVSGHIAYSGIFGYFIGMAAMRRADFLKLLLVGLLISAFLHGLWDSNNLFLLLLTPVASYIILGATILKARQISPTRADNFTSWVMTPQAAPAQLPTIAGPSPKPENPPAIVAPPAVAPVAVELARPLPPRPPGQPARFKLLIMGDAIPLGPDTRIEQGRIPGLVARDSRQVAQVVARPDKPEVLGLNNLSDTVWTVTLKSGKVVQIGQDTVVRLSHEMRIEFGGFGSGVVEEIAA